MTLPAQLAFPLAAPIASFSLDAARSAVEGFASLFDDAKADVSAPTDSPTSTIDEIQSAIAEHLKALGIDAEQPLTITVGDDAVVEVTAQTPEADSLESVLTEDQDLVQQLAEYLRPHSPLSRRLTLHWPVSSGA